MAANIHPTAQIDPSARLGADVQIGPHAIVEADTALGDRCRLMPYAIVRRYSRLGQGNVLHPFVVLGGEPQDLKFEPATVSGLVIGDGNVFREGVTVSRATGEGNQTLIGDHNYLMTASHVGHNARLGSHCVLVNGAALAGHAELGDRAILSAHVAIHQFCWVGDMVMSQGNAIVTQHVPPYCLFAGATEIIGLNRVGLRRAANLTDHDRKQIQEAYRLVYRSRLPLPRILAEMDARTDWGPAAGKLRDFIRRVVQACPPHGRGLAQPRHRARGDVEA